jgi:hypothetical protein
MRVAFNSPARNQISGQEARTIRCSDILGLILLGQFNLEVNIEVGNTQRERAEVLLLLAQGIPLRR